jgi:hypothetical protein
VHKPFHTVLSFGLHSSRTMAAVERHHETR